MSFLLRMKPGWLFALMIMPFVFQIITIFSGFATAMANEGGEQDELLYGTMILGALMVLSFFGSIVLTYGWMYNIGTGLYQKLPPGHNLKLDRFKFAFFFPLVYLAGFGCFVLAAPAVAPAIAGWFFVIIPLHLSAMACMFYVFRYVAKSLKAVEMQKPIKFGDYAGEFFLFWFYFIGVWIIQPRVNKIFAGQEERNVYGGPVDRYLK